MVSLRLLLRLFYYKEGNMSKPEPQVVKPKGVPSEEKITGGKK